MQAMIFDFNGTMVMDTHLHRRAWGEFLQEKTGRVLTDAEFAAYIFGPPNADILRRFCGEGLTDAEVEALSEEKEVRYRALCDAEGERFHLLEGLPELLKGLRERGMPFTIATGSCLSNLRFYFERLDLGRWFDFDRVVYEDGTLPGKPDPAIFLRACAVLGEEPANCTVFEDSFAGLESAHRAGIGEVVALSTSNPAHALAGLPGVSRVIADYREYDFRCK